MPEGTLAAAVVSISLFSEWFIEKLLFSYYDVLYGVYVFVVTTSIDTLSAFDIVVITSFIPIVFGIALIFWGVVGGIRLVVEQTGKLFEKPSQAKTPTYNETESYILPWEVAIIVPAHNEELVIKDTIDSLLGIASRSDLYVVSDGSKDRTVEIATELGVNVLENKISKGKAGALEACIAHFDLRNRYKAVLFVDADTRLDSKYLINGLPLFSDPKVIAVAGYAKTIWNPENLSPSQKLFILHRDRVYFLSQAFIKFGQTWQHTNVTHIIPGFASMYRTSVLDKITMNPPGIVIEDFNMTFEVHHKKLGTIAHSPGVIGYTQDPDNGTDYFKQIKRWHLGLWQTIRMHRMWPSLFCFALTLTLIEVVLGSIVFLLLPLTFVLRVVVDATIFFGFSNGSILEQYIPSAAFLLWSFVVVFLADYALTVLTAVSQKRWAYLLYGLAFPFVRFLDAVAFLGAIPRAFFVTSTGKWVSPTRRTST